MTGNAATVGDSHAGRLTRYGEFSAEGVNDRVIIFRSGGAAFNFAISIWIDRRVEQYDIKRTTRYPAMRLSRDFSIKRQLDFDLNASHVAARQTMIVTHSDGGMKMAVTLIGMRDGRACLRYRHRAIAKVEGVGSNRVTGVGIRRS